MVFYTEAVKMMLASNVAFAHNESESDYITINSSFEK